MTKSLAIRANETASAGGGGEQRKRQARAAQRREQLLDVALALFTERGYRETSVRDITRAAGVTEAVLYHYFANKAELWAAAVHAHAPFGSLGQILDDVKDAPLDEALWTLGGELLRRIRSRERLVLTLLSEAPAEAEVARMLERFLSETTAALAQFLAVRRERGEIAANVDTIAAARAFQGSLFVHLLTTSLTPRPFEPEADAAAVDSLVSLLMRGLARRAESSAYEHDRRREAKTGPGLALTCPRRPYPGG